MTYIQIAEHSAEITNVFKNIIVAEQAEDIYVNENDSDEMTELLCAANLEKEISLERYGKLKIIIAGVKDVAKIKNIPSDRQTQIQLITCGWEEKDTFTYSSVNEDEVILNLQRKITSLNGDAVSPYEIKISREEYGIKNQDDEAVLFAFCIYQCLRDGNNLH